MGTFNDATNEDRDEYLKIKYTTNQVATNKNPNIIFIENKIPI